MNERLRLDPEDAEALAERGRRWVNLGQYERAPADFAAALCVDDEDTVGLWGRAMVWACCPDARFRNGPAALESAELADSLGGSSLLVFGRGRPGFSMDFCEMERLLAADPRADRTPRGGTGEARLPLLP
jgi:hypothetical protein